MVAAHEVQLHAARRARLQRPECVDVAGEDGLEPGQALVLGEPDQLERVTDEDDVLLRTGSCEYLVVQEFGQHAAGVAGVLV